MTLDEAIEELKQRDNLAAIYVEALIEKAGTTDCDWCILEAAGKMMADLCRLKCYPGPNLLMMNMN